tara:strand:- start:447 stop:1115 length:669 start_codon:yes stop_codon:yes gene_type:complete
MNNLVFIIPARRNSKTIPFKNRKKINGLSLVDHAISFCENFNSDEIILSTDDEFFLENQKYKDYSLRRPDNLATDESIISDVMLELVETKSLHDKFIILLEPSTLPRDPQHLDCLFNGEFENSKSSSIASFAKSPLLKEKIWISEKGKLMPDSNLWKRRQDYAKQYTLTGHYYGFFGKDIFKFYPGLCDENVFPIFIQEYFADINDFKDLEEAKLFLENIQK